jgi:hypothetical protein
LPGSGRRASATLSDLRKARGGRGILGVGLYVAEMIRKKV